MTERSPAASTCRVSVAERRALENALGVTKLPIAGADVRRDVFDVVPRCVAQKARTVIMALSMSSEHLHVLHEVGSDLTERASVA